MKTHQTLCHQQIYRQVTKEILEPLTPPGRRSRALGCCVAILLSWFGFTSPFKGECWSDHLYPMKKHFYPEWVFFSNGKAPIHPYLFKEWCCRCGVGVTEGFIVRVRWQRYQGWLWVPSCLQCWMTGWQMRSGRSLCGMWCWQTTKRSDLFSFFFAHRNKIIS